MTRGLWLAVLLLACSSSKAPPSAAAACSTDEVRCDQSGFCPAGTHCVGTGCFSGCAQDADCPFSQSCISGACGCAEGRHACGTACAANDDVNACGASCTVCPSTANGAAVCLAGSCGLRCRPGFALCNGACVDRSVTPAAFTVNLGPTLRSPPLIEVADLNGDGIPDIAAVNSDGLALLRGAGDGTFVVPEGALPVKDPTVTQLKTAFLDGTGQRNLVVVGLSGDVTVFRVSQTFFQQISVFTPPPAFMGGPLAIGDLDGDGKLDAVFSGGVDQTLGFLAGTATGDGKGSFTFARSIKAWGGGPIVIGDFDGDGVMDFALAEFTEVSVYFGRGGGAFREPLLLETPELVDGLITADLDHDGHPDLLAHSRDGSLTLFFSRPLRRFIPQPSFKTPFGPLLDAAQGMVVGNFEGSGFDDVAIGTPDALFLYRIVNGSFSLVGNAPLLAQQLHVADLNGDGWPDLVGTGTAGELVVALGHCQP
jgi:FG-GAP-like repeat